MRQTNISNETRIKRRE